MTDRDPLERLIGTVGIPQPGTDGRKDRHRRADNKQCLDRRL
jgi:hypothetical protein